MADDPSKQYGIKVDVIIAELSNDSDFQKLVDAVKTKDDIEMLINNAGYSGYARHFEEIDVAEHEKMVKIHQIIPMRLVSLILPGMIKRGKGNIINVSSVAGFLQSPFSVSYNATKAWLNSFTTGLYVELKSIRSPVRVQALCPGFTCTEFQETAGVDRGKIPKSLWMSAEEVVHISLRGLERDKLIVVPGWRYRLFLAAMRILPQSFKRFLAIQYGRSSLKSGGGAGYPPRIHAD